MRRDRAAVVGGLAYLSILSNLRHVQCWWVSGPFSSAPSRGLVALAPSGKLRSARPTQLWGSRGINRHRRVEKNPANETHALSGYDANNPFFTVDYSERDAEEEFLLELDKGDKDAYTETFSGMADRQRKAQEARDRHDFTCLTIEQVARSYQVPISWLGDALVNFGVLPPIQWNARIGDLIGGEDAASILEALHGWDHSVMYDMYIWDSIRDLASSHDLRLSDILRVCDEEGFALPFGIRSRLRWEQYARLMRRLNRADELSDEIRERFKDPDYPDTTT